MLGQLLIYGYLLYLIAYCVGMFVGLPIFILLKTQNDIDLISEFMLFQVFNAAVLFSTVLICCLMAGFFEYISLYSILFKRRYYKLFKILLSMELYSYENAYWNNDDLIFLTIIYNKTKITLIEYFGILNILNNTSKSDYDKLLILIDMYGQSILFISLLHKFYDISVFIIHQNCSLDKSHLKIIRRFDMKALRLYQHYTNTIRSNIHDNIEM